MDEFFSLFHILSPLHWMSHFCICLVLPWYFLEKRSLGDSVAHMAGVISEPEFTERVLDPEKDKFVIVATDGLWEFMDNTTCVNLACKASGPSDAVDALVKEANQRWIQEEQVIDDTTVIVAHLFDYQGGVTNNATSNAAVLRN